MKHSCMVVMIETGWVVYVRGKRDRESARGRIRRLAVQDRCETGDGVGYGDVQIEIESGAGMGSIE